MGAKYAFLTEWRVAAPVEAAWEKISRPLDWPRWWQGVVSVEELEHGEASGLGALHRYTWKSALPYRLAFDMRVTRVEEPQRLEGRAMGELDGTGVWTFEATADGWSLVRYSWQIETTRRWMNQLSWLLRPAFEWNHDYVMRSGARGLARELGVPVQPVERRQKRRWPVVALAGVVAAAGGALALRQR